MYMLKELKAMALEQDGEVPVWMSQLVALTNQSVTSGQKVSPLLDASGKYLHIQYSNFLTYLRCW